MEAEADISPTLAAKVDQLVADDLTPRGSIGGPITVRVESVTMKASDDQPMTIKLVGRLPFRPCKTMRRLLAEAWGKDATKWKGREMTIYTDPEIAFGGQKIGGIRISHLSDIPGPLVVNLTSTKGQKRPWKVLPIAKAAQGASAAWTVDTDHPSWEADREAFVAELAKLDLDVATVDAKLAEDAAMRKWWNGSDCQALQCSWVPTKWRVNLVAMLARKKADAAAKAAAESKQGD
jgi:hypothetical protein